MLAKTGCSGGTEQCVQRWQRSSVFNAVLTGVSSDSDVRCAVLRDDACMPETSRVFALCNPVFTIIFT